MKRCPECRRDYYDETLMYCLEDGVALVQGTVPSPDETATAILSEREAIATEFRDGDVTRPQMHPTGADAESRKSLGDSTEKHSLSAHRAAKPLAVLIALLVLVGAFFGYRYFNPNIKQIDSIAVMPFVNESGNPDVEYLSDGMTDSLINALSPMPNLSVKSRNSVFRYKGAEIDEKKVGRELAVQAILLGRITQRGDDITLHLSLVDSTTGTSLWGHQYDRRIQDLAVLQKEITRDVSQKLQTRISAGDATKLTRNYTENGEAYQLFLKGRYFWAKRNPETIGRAIEYFNLAIEKDPDFPLAYVGLADAYVVPANQMAPREAMPKAKAAALRALEIDDTLAEAHTSLARVLQVYDWNWKEAEREYKRAIELNPRYPIAHQWYGGYLERTGRLDEAVAERRIALELDPLSSIASFEMGQTFYFARDYDRAIEQFEKTLELDPNFPAALQYLPLVYIQKGMFDKSIEVVQTASENTGSPGYVYAMAGRTKEALAMIEKLKALRGKAQYISPLGIASTYAALGDKEKAFEWLEKGYEERSFQMQLLNLDPRWDKVRDDPRFADLASRVGLPR